MGCTEAQVLTEPKSLFSTLLLVKPTPPPWLSPLPEFHSSPVAWVGSGDRHLESPWNMGTMRSQMIPSTWICGFSQQRGLSLRSPWVLPALGVCAFPLLPHNGHLSHLCG